MRILVTGGAGFIGSHCIESLGLANNEIHVIDNLSSGRAENLPQGVTLHAIDIRSAEAAKVIANLKPELLIHTAAQMSVRESMADPQYDVDVNVSGLINILHALPKSDLPFFVFLSTGGAIYGEQDVFPCDENHPTRPISVYGASKLASEIYLALWQRAYGLKYAVLRLSNVYGPRQNPHGEAGVVAIFSKALLNSQAVSIYGDGQQTRDYIFVKDVAAAVKQVAAAKATGVFNIGTGQETSVNQLYSSMAELAGVNSAANFLPSRSGEQLRSCIDPRLAEQVFTWKAEVDLAAGLTQTLNWAKEHLK